MYELIGYFCALLIGITLGLIGGGGSILTVPVLVYIMGIEPVLATAYSLFVVGLSALIATIKNFKLKNIEIETGLVFALPSLFAVYFTRSTIVPAIPDTIFTIGSFTLSKQVAIMLFFALIMLLASISMIKGRKDSIGEKNKKLNYPIIVLEGLVVGALTGLVGAGGGFLIIPALVILAGLPMKKAVGTSLMIITIKSLIGFTGDLSGDLNIDWAFLLLFSALSAIGIAIGIYFGKFIEGHKLKKAFGYFVLIMAVFILSKELML